MHADIRTDPRTADRVGRRACGPLQLAAVAALIALLSGSALAGPPPVSLAVLRERVAAAVQEEGRARTLDERATAVRQLLGLHQEIGGHPRFTASNALQGLQRHLAIRLGATRQALLRDYGDSQKAASGGGANQALALVDIIQQTIHPDFWDVHGGSGKVVYFEQGRGLVVLGTEQVHDDVGNLLDQLRRAGP